MLQNSENWASIKLLTPTRVTLGIKCLLILQSPCYVFIKMLCNFECDFGFVDDLLL